MGQLPRLRLVPPLDEWSWARRGAGGVPGRLALVAVFTVGLHLHEVGAWLETGLVLALTSVFPRRRRLLLALAALGWLSGSAWFPWSAVENVARAEGVFERIDWDLLRPLAIAAGLGWAVLYHAAARKWPAAPGLRRPLVTWIGLHVLLLAVASYAPLGGEARVACWAVSVVLGKYIWFVAFSLLDRHTREPLAPLRQLAFWQPFWMASSHLATPIPKGAAYLRKVEAADSAALALCQLKGVKLLWWAGVLVVLEQVVEWFLHGNPRAVPRALGLEMTLALPGFGAVFDAHLAGAPHGLGTAWAALVARFVSRLLSLAIWGHVIVATCRMAGFGVLRNTYRPLESTTIAEFWNRYYYYFKELLVEVFFYPTFLRYLKRRPRARLFVATLAAAGGGNVLYHFLEEAHPLAERGLFGALWDFRVYVLYGAILGTAIAVSQLRRKRRDAPRSWVSRRILAPLFVLTFYCVLGVFDAPLRSTSIGAHLGFLLSLVGQGAAP